jgi:hypothetical protein
MTTRLGNDDYKRPKQTLQEKFTVEEQQEKLIGYKEIKDQEEIKDIPLGTEIRYFVFGQQGTKVIKKFRLGGKLINKNNADKFIVLASGIPPNQKTWSVQVKNSELYYKLNVEDVIEEQQEKIGEIKDKYVVEIAALKAEVKQLKEEKKEVILKYNKLVDKYDKLKKTNKEA